MTTKSILKNPVDGGKQAVNSRNLALATHHARLLEEQKDIEATVLQSIESMLDLPSSSDADPAQPSNDDASKFVDLIVPFQPGDYDCLIEERHAAGKCGYTLCPRRPRSETSKFRIFQEHRRAEVKIVSKQKLENWCSEDCARRALYVKLQLMEEPAWSRRADVRINVLLMIGHNGDLRVSPSSAEWPAAQEAFQWSASNTPESVNLCMKNLSLGDNGKRSSVAPVGVSTHDVQERPMAKSEK